MITNYVLNIQKNICPTYSDMFIKQTDNIRILKYNVGEYIDDHSDIGPNIRASCTLNLNEDYEGGQIQATFSSRGSALLFAGIGGCGRKEGYKISGHSGQPLLCPSRHYANRH